MDFLHSGSLYFSRLDKLEDPFEGLPSEEDFTRFLGDPGAESLLRVIHDANRFNVFVNSWYIAEDEPASMWKLYAGVDAGIALCSTYDRLQRAVSLSPHGVQLSLVSYGRPPVDGTLIWQYALWKRKSFEHEREVRALIPPRGLVMGSTRKGRGAYKPKISQDKRIGIHVPVKMNDLVTDIVLSPTAPTFVLDALHAIRRGFKLRSPLRQSRLYVLDFDES